MLKKIKKIPIFGIQLLVSILFNFLVIDYIWIRVDDKEDIIPLGKIFTIKGTVGYFKRYPLIYKSTNDGIYWRIKMLDFEKYYKLNYATREINIILK